MPALQASQFAQAVEVQAAGGGHVGKLAPDLPAARSQIICQRTRQRQHLDEADDAGVEGKLEEIEPEGAAEDRIGPRGSASARGRR